MKVAVKDANIFIDLETMGLLDRIEKGLRPGASGW